MWYFVRARGQKVKPRRITSNEFHDKKVSGCATVSFGLRILLPLVSDSFISKYCLLVWFRSAQIWFAFEVVATSKALTSLGMRFKWIFHIFVGKKCFTSKIFIYIYWKRGLINFEFFRESSSKRGIRFGPKPFQVWDYLNLLEVTMVGRVLWNWIGPFFHPSVCLSICLKSFLGLVHYFFSETQHGVRNPCEVKRDNFVKLWH